MKGLIQRVTHASVTVDNESISEIGSGLLLLLGVEKSDDSCTVRELCRKLLSYRVFPDDQGRMNRSLFDMGGSLLVFPSLRLLLIPGPGPVRDFRRLRARNPRKHCFMNSWRCVSRSWARIGLVRVGSART